MIKNKGNSHDKNHYDNMAGIFYMLIHVIALASLYTAVKSLTKGLEPAVVVFLYKLTILICIIPWCFYKGISEMKTKRIGLHIFRGFLSVFAQIFIFYGLKNLAISDVTAIQYLEHVLVMIIGILYFKEQATKTKIIAIIISFVGTLLISFPKLFTFDGSMDDMFSGFNYNLIFVFAGLVFYAINNTTVKILGKTEKTKVQLFYVTIVSLFFAFPIAFMEWKGFYNLFHIQLNYPYKLVDIDNIGLENSHFFGILFLALCYFIHSICHFRAFKIAEISTIIPFEYSRLIFAAILGYVFLNDKLPDGHKIFGYLLIIGSGLFLLYSEKRKMQRTKISNQIKEEFEQ